MKANAIVRIILFSIAILVLGGILIGGVLLYTFSVNSDWSGISEFVGGFFVSNDGTIASTGFVSPSEVKNIEINWTSGSVTIQKGDVENITFAENTGLSESEKMIWKMKGDTLVINNSQYRVIIGISISKAKDLVITVPTDWDCKELEVNSVSADITVDSIAAEDVGITVVDGNCDFLGTCAVGELSIETVDGDIFYSGILNDLECEGVSADFRGTFTATPHSIELSTVDGNIDLILPPDAGFTAELDTVDGNFTSDFVTSASGSRYVCGDGKCSIEISGVSGDITINMAK